ncbi:peptidylprolyl isomerase [Clostridium sp. CCUG 7971]|uniref:peptidylprolyl isomerase n=1 Tax=Clostridium sp. CCUG 7971 TaxID=2811414 RepID=UPI001ABA76EE|nr:peptidylprolyl isomerase [Clostridium sp. CCUG 7971]MBO3444068.1 peptidylprolyl isomerase [Clostridium sp. CCUG 7971]
MKKIMAIAMSIMLGVSMTACSSGPKNDDVVATVNDKKITVAEYKKALDLNKQATESMYGESIWDMEVEKGKKYKEFFKDSVMEQMINTQILFEQAKKENLLPSKEDVDKKFKEFEKSIAENKAYKENMKKLGITNEDIKKEQEIGLAIQNYQDNFKKVTKISDEDIKKYYEDNKKEFYEDKVRASHILISTVDENNKPLSEAKKAEAKKKAEDILKKAKNGEEFATLAKEYSDDKGSGAKGGDLDFFEKGAMVPEFEAAAWGLKVGEISELVETQFGYHIIKVTDKSQKQLTFDEVKDTIKDKLLGNKYTETIKKLTKDAKIEKNEKSIESVKF